MDISFLPTFILIIVLLANLGWPEQRKKNPLGFDVLLAVLVGWQMYLYGTVLNYYYGTPKVLVSLSSFNAVLLLWVITTPIAIYGKMPWNRISSAFSLVSGAITLTIVGFLGLTDSVQIVRWVTIPVALFFASATLLATIKGMIRSGQ